MTSTESYIFSPDASLRSPVTPAGWLAGAGSAEQCGECRTWTDWLFNEPLKSLIPWPLLPLWAERTGRDTPELMHGLALTKFLDCNTRHVECSTCYVPSFQAKNHNCNNNNNNETCRNTERKQWHRYKPNKRNRPGDVSLNLSEFTGT